MYASKKKPFAFKNETNEMDFWILERERVEESLTSKGEGQHTILF